MSGKDGGTDGNQQQSGGQQQGGSDGKQQENNSFKPVTYNSQEELDAAFADRATRAAESAKQEALKALTDAGVSVEDALAAYNAQKAAEDAKKDPAVKEREAREKAERELAEYKARETQGKLRVEVAKDLKVKIGNTETPIPAELLAGTTKEEMQEHGKSLIAFIGQLAGQAQAGPRSPGYNPLQGQNGNDKVAAGDPLRNYFQTGSFT
ncbi:scaffolding protein [Mycobacterium phage NoShow]|nr:scaffolding protein [Mycobacterium phage NoShow]